MKIKTKRRLTLACVFALGLSVAAGGAALGVLDANATTAPFAIDEGAAVRTDAPAGIRFETTIGGEAYETYKAQNATFGTVVMPQAMLGENALTLGMENSLNVVAENWIEAKADDPLTVDVNERVMQFNAVIVGEYDETTKTYAGLPEELYGTKLVARSYVTVDGNTTYAEGTAVRSIAQVASLALADKSEDANYTEAEIEFMNEITNYVATTESNVLDDVKVNLLAETINDTIALPEGCGEVYGVYLLPSGYEIDAENYTVDGNAVKFAEAYLKGFGYNSEFTLKINAENGCYSVKTSFYGEVADTERFFGFNNSADAQYVSYENAAEWLPEFNGEKGVVKMTMSNIWSGLTLNLPYTAEQLSAMSWDYFDIRMYTTMDGDIFEDNWPSAKKDAWATVRLTKANVLTIFADEATFYDRLINGNTRLFAFWNAGTVYVDYVDFKTAAEEEFTGLQNFADEDTMTQVPFGGTREWLASYEGATGVVKGAYTDSWHGVQFRLNTTAAKLAEMQWNYVEFKMTVDFTSTRTSWDGLTSNAAGWSYTTDGVWRIYKATRDGIVNQFGTVENFYTAITTGNSNNDDTRMFTLWNMTAHGNFYFDYFKLGYEVIEVLPEFEGVDSFDNSLTVSNVYGLVDAKWKESYKGATGVVSGKYDDDWIGVQVRLNTTAEKLSAMDWDYVEIKVTVDFSTGTRESWDGVYSNTAGWSYTTDGDWRIYKATKDGIVAQFGSVDNFYKAITTGTGTDSTSRLFTLWNMKSHGTFYFDYFKLGKTETAE